MVTEAEKYERFVVLRRWLHDEVGVCQGCSVGFALAQTERELGDPHWKSAAGECRRHLDAASPRLSCREKAKAAWARMPKPAKPAERKAAA